MSIFRVSVENVTPIWPQVAPLVESALRGAPTHDAEDVRRMLLGQNCQLWIQWNEPAVEAAVITEFAVYPKGVWLRAWLAGARRDAEMDDVALKDALTMWAQANGCRGFEANGRHGWLRRFPGAKVEGLFMRLTFP